MIVFLTKENVTQALENQAQQLFTQLSRRKQIGIVTLLNQNPAPFIIAYIENGNLLGMATMATYKAISGYKGWVEDVVVDKNERCKQIGTKLIQGLIEKANELDLDEMLLFVSPDNNPALTLYNHQGFNEKGTKVLVKALHDMYPNGR